MNQAWLLAQRSLRESLRAPEALLPTLFTRCSSSS